MLTFSNSPMWTTCAASIHPAPAIHPPQLEKQQDDARREGTAAAWLVNMVLRGDAADASEGLGEFAPNGWPIDAVMIRHAQDYIDLVRRHGEPLSETETSLFDGRVTGRIDQHLVDGDTLRVYEFKYGYKIVEPYGNPQLLLAAISMLRDFHRLISLEVYQPRPAHPSGKHRKWVLDRDELEVWRNWLLGCVEATGVQRPMATPGDQCVRCDRRAGCHALASNIYAIADLLATNHPAKPLPAADLGLELELIDRMEKFLKARKSGSITEASERARKGEFIPGYYLEDQYGDRAWKVTPINRQIATNIDPYKRVEKSPAEVEKEGGNVDDISAPPFIGKKLKKWDAAKVGRRFKT